MVNKVMQIFYGADCLPYKDQARAVHFPVVGNSFMGASNTTEIRFYIDRLGNTSATWVVIAKLPNGKIGSQVLSVAYDDELDENYAYLQLNTWFTQHKGDLYISLNGYQGGISLEYDEDTGLYSVPNGTPVIEATGSVKLSIQYATQIVGSDEIDEITLQEIYALFGTKLNITDGLVVIESRTSALATNYENGQVVYSKTDNKFYKVVNSAYELVLDPMANHIGIIPVSSLSNIISSYSDEVQKDLCFIIYNNEIYVKSANNQVIGTTTYYVFMKVDELGKTTNSNYYVDTYTKNGILVNASSYALSAYTIQLGSYYNKTGADSTFATITNLNNVSVVANDADSKIDSHIANKNNPHEVTKTQLGLGNVDNTSDNNKPISVAQQQALNLKANASDVYTKSQSDNKYQTKLTAGVGIAISGNVISSTGAISFQIVNSLPQTGTNGVFYLIPLSESETNNAYEEYVWVSSTSSFEKIGTTKVDLSDYYDKDQIDALIGAKQDDLPTVINGKFLKANNSTGDLEWDSPVQNNTTTYGATVSANDWEDLKDSTSLVLENTTISGIDTSYDFTRVKFSINSIDYQVLLKKNEQNRYVGIFDIEENDYLYEIGVYYNGTNIVFRSSRYNVIPNNALVDSVGDIIVDINGNYLVATEGE